ncbi:MAG: LPS-assembly protein LptD [Chitinophagaceae bacterium]|nr:LPS-assembly protein LptD [Chitinophagaceae bacterium]
MRDSIPLTTDSSAVRNRIDTFRIRLSPDTLGAPVEYKASDSMVLEVDTKRILLYGKTEVKYTDVTLTAPTLVFDQQSQVVTARMGRDSTGNVTGLAKLVQANTTTVSDSIRFNFKSQKGLTYSSFFQQDEIYNFAEKVKKVDAQTFYAARGRFTTCNLDTPHFAFRFGKAKFVNQKVAVTGPVHPEFEDVPVPLWLPFGIFPLQSGRHSGFIPPQFTVTEQFGIGLEGLGYYKVINDYLDAKFWADVYSYGSYRLNLSPTYRKRYRYNGSFNLSYQNTKFAFKGDPDYSQTKSFFVTWNHSMDSKARPGVTFNASVNAGSSKYLSLVPNGALVNPGTVSSGASYLQPINFTNQLQSSISYQKSWAGKPFNLSVNLNHNQNTTTRLVNLNLPDIAFVVNTVYPFQPKDFVGAGKWYHKLGIGYNTNFKGQTSFYDTAFNFRQIIDTFQWGAAHDIPIILSLPALGPLQVAPNFTYRERWYAQKFIRSWNAAEEKVDTSIQKGFFTAREMTVGLSVSTALFGTYQSKKKEARVQAIRHVMRPTFGFNYKPDLMEPYYYKTQVDTFGNEIQFSVFDGAIFQPFSPGQTGGISFGLDNNLEMKVRSKNDTSNGGIQKVKILEGFGITGGYNFLADSFKLSTFNLYARSMLFEKINITANATLNPYKTNPLTGRPIDEYAWEGGDFSLGRISSGGVNISTTLQSKKKNDDKESLRENLEKNQDNLTPDQVMQQLDYVRRNPAEFTDFNIPWSLNLGFNLSFSSVLQPNYSFKTELSSSFNFSGDFNISPKWKVGATGFYDLRTSKIQSLTTFITRDLHCWQMSINITPVGLYRFFNISINPKSGLLRDLRINRTRYFYSN